MAADFEQVKQNIADTIYENGEELITGQVMQDRLLEMVSVTEEAINDVTIDPTVNVTVDNTTGTPSGSASFQNNQFSFEFSGIKGETGNSGYTGAAGELEVVNNLTSDDATAALSAYQGKVLDGKITKLGQEVDDYLDIPEGPITFSSYTINGYLDASTGEVEASSYGRTTDFIPVRGVKNISGKFKAAANMLCVAFYDDDKNLIPSLNQVGTGGWSDYNVNVGGTAYASAKYYRLSVYDFSQGWDVYFSLTITAESYLDSISNISENLGITYTTLDPSLVSEVGFVDDANNGHIDYSTHGRHTNPISIHGLKTITAYLKGSSNVACISFFDKDGNYLPALSVLGTGSWTNYSLDIAEEKYTIADSVIISVYDFSDAWSYIQLSGTYEQRLDKDEAIIRNLSESVNEAKSDLSAISSKFVEDGSFLLSENGYVRMDGEIEASTYGRHTNYIQVVGYDYVMVDTKASTSSAAIAFYDENKQCITALSIAGTDSRSQIRINLKDAEYTGVAYIRVGAYDWNSLFDQYSAQVISTSSITEEIKGEPDAIIGMNSLIFGDSITECASIVVNASDQTTRYSMGSPSNTYVNGGGVTINYDMWPRILQKMTKVGDVRNYARSGASWRTQSRESGEERRNVQYQITVALNDLSNPNGVFPTDGTLNPDSVIFALGTNDGTITDTYETAMAKTIYQSDGVSVNVDATINNLDDTLTCESIRKAFMRIRKVLITSQIYCVLPIMRANSDFKTGIPAQVREALIKFSEEYGVIIIDGTFESGIIRDGNIQSNLGTTLKDGLHPNEVGQNLIARLIVSRIRATYIPFTSAFNPQ